MQLLHDSWQQWVKWQKLDRLLKSCDIWAGSERMKKHMQRKKMVRWNHQQIIDSWEGRLEGTLCMLKSWLVSVSTAECLRGGPRTSCILSVEVWWKCKSQTKTKSQILTHFLWMRDSEGRLSNQYVKEPSGDTMFPGGSDASGILRASGLQGQTL